MSRIIGRRLKIIRKKLGLNQDQWAEKLNITPAGLNQYESGKAEIPDSLEIKLLKDFKVSLNWLLSGQGEIFNINKREHEKKQTEVLKVLSKMNLDDIHLMALINEFELDRSQKELLAKFIRFAGEALASGGTITFSS